MNNERRKRLSVVHELLSRLYDEVGEISSEEEEAMENMPESLQYNSDRWDAAEEAVQQIEEARDSIETAMQSIEDHVIGNVNNKHLREFILGL